MPRKRLQRARLRFALGAGPLAVTSSPESKEVQDGPPETKGVRHQLSGGVGVQGSPPKGDKVWETQRGPRGPAVQTRPESLEMRQVPPSTLQLLFQGISHDGQGRASYLRERHRRSRRSFCTRSCHPGSTAGTWVRAATILPLQASAGRPGLPCARPVLNYPAGTSLSLGCTLLRAGPTPSHLQGLHTFSTWNVPPASSSAR